MHESLMQAVLMNWCMEDKRHQIVLPNVTLIYRWEADLLSATRAWLVHEFEIKLTASDYRADAQKRRKHSELLRVFNGTGGSQSVPNYFWYVTNGFELDPERDLPPYAGWMRIYKKDTTYRYGWWIRVEVAAPRIHVGKMRERTRLKVARWLSYKLKNEYYGRYVRSGEQGEPA